MEEHLYRKYLDILNITEKKPGPDYLNELVKAHLIRIPFENISKIYYWKIKKLTGLPDLALHLDGIGRYQFGGTCFVLNYYFNLLLAQLGFDVKLCGGDMAKPDVHIFNIVTLDGSEYIVDVGFAAPFYSPINRNLNIDTEIKRGNVKHVIKPQDEQKRTRIEIFEADKLKLTLIDKPEARQITDFSESIEDSYNEKSMFINSLFLTRFHEFKTIEIYNLKVTESFDDKTVSYDMQGRDELIEAVNNKFDIPEAIIVPVIKELTRLDEILKSLR